MQEHDKVIYTYVELIPGYKEVEVELHLYEGYKELGMYAAAKVDNEEIISTGDTIEEIRKEMTERLSKFADPNWKTLWRIKIASPGEHCWLEKIRYNGHCYQVAKQPWEDEEWYPPVFEQPTIPDFDKNKEVIFLDEESLDWDQILYDFKLKVEYVLWNTAKSDGIEGIRVLKLFLENLFTGTFEKALSDLAMEFREINSKGENVGDIVYAYKSVLEAMIRSGMKKDLSVDDKLPNAHMPDEYFEWLEHFERPQRNRNVDQQ